MDIRQQLEQQIRDTWSMESLAVYADLLLESDDATDVYRGQLCVLDLNPGGEEWTQQYLQVLQQWLGPLGAQVTHLVRFGFAFITAVEAWEAQGTPQSDLIATLLDSPLGPYVCTYQLTPEAGLEQYLQDLWRLAAQPRPWLTQLIVEAWTTDTSHRFASLGTALQQVAPNLQKLYYFGPPDFLKEASFDELEVLYISTSMQRPLSKAPIRTLNIDFLDWLEMLREDCLLGQFMEAIAEEKSVYNLQCVFQDLISPHATTHAILSLLHQAQLVNLVGSRVGLTKFGECLLSTPENRAPVMPDIRHGYNVWGRRQGQARRLLFQTGLRKHLESLESWLTVLSPALSKQAHQSLLRYHGLLLEVFDLEDAECWAGRCYNEPKQLFAAIREVIAIVIVLDALEISDTDPYFAFLNFQNLEEDIREWAGLIEDLEDGTGALTFAISWR